MGFRAPQLNPTPKSAGKDPAGTEGSLTVLSAMHGYNRISSGAPETRFSFLFMELQKHDFQFS